MARDWDLSTPDALAWHAPGAPTAPSWAELDMAGAGPTRLGHLEPGRFNAALLQVAGSLAERLDAAVIGVAARQPAQSDVSGTCYVSPGLIEAARAGTEAELGAAEIEVREALRGPASSGAPRCPAHRPATTSWTRRATPIC